MTHQSIKNYFPGLITVLVIALSASFMSEHYGGPKLIYALFFGIAFHFLSEDPKAKLGIDFSARTILRLGVALLGGRIAFSQVADLGALPLILIGASVLLTMLFGVFLGKMLERNAANGLLIGGAVAICGASAAVAISATLPHRAQSTQYTVLTIVGVTTLSTLCMIVYPILASLMGLDPHETGVFLGGAIHDVAQVVGAGYTVSREAGDTATIVKLFRVAMLIPIVVAITLITTRTTWLGAQDSSVEPAPATAKKPPLFPLFLMGFLVLAAINSFGGVPVQAVSWLTTLSSFCLTLAISALGVKTSFKELLALGWRPMTQLVASTVVIALLSLVGIYTARMF